MVAFLRQNEAGNASELVLSDTVPNTSGLVAGAKVPDTSGLVASVEVSGTVLPIRST